jgi:hypothetical protein
MNPKWEFDNFLKLIIFGIYLTVLVNNKRPQLWGGGIGNWRMFHGMNFSKINAVKYEYFLCSALP